jgi:hypothetical protein
MVIAFGGDRMRGSSLDGPPEWKGSSARAGAASAISFSRSGPSPPGLPAKDHLGDRHVAYPRLTLFRLDCRGSLPAGHEDVHCTMREALRAIIGCRFRAKVLKSAVV